MKPYEYKGKVAEIYPTMTFPSGFAKRELILCEDPNADYLNYAKFEFLKTKKADLTLLLDRIAVGDTVTVKFYIEANENPKKAGQWFSSNRAIQIVGEDGNEITLSSPSAAPASRPAANAQAASVGDPLAADDDMPF